MNQLIHNLQNAVCYPHPTSDFKLIETHLSWVILTGDYVYKIKKPVKFEFVDFSTLEKRQFYCQREYELNHQFAPAIYLEVLPIQGSVDQPNFLGEGPVIEYALKMRAYPQEALMEVQLKKGTIHLTMISSLAKKLAEFHQTTPTMAKASSFGSPTNIYQPIQANFTTIYPLITNKAHYTLLQACERWASQYFEGCKSLIHRRYQAGCIRACHGDLHTGNIAFIDQQPLLLDCIEFNENFRWLDPLNDIGFLTMDLHHKKQMNLANRLINDYFQLTGDYQGLPLLKFYEAYRAMVRVKVSLLRLTQSSLDSTERFTLQQHYESLLELAHSYIKSSLPQTYITCGFSGSGKSTVATYLVDHNLGLHLQADRERKRLAKRDAVSIDKLYSDNHTQKTYHHLKKLALILLKAGYSPVIDACCLKQWQRELFNQITNHSPIFIHCQAPFSILIKRIVQRLETQNTLSDADLTVLDKQQTSMEPLSIEEKLTVIVFASSEMAIARQALDNLIWQINQRQKITSS